jgi:hypothetical protein
MATNWPRLTPNAFKEAYAVPPLHIKGAASSCLMPSEIGMVYRAGYYQNTKVWIWLDLAQSEANER